MNKRKILASGSIVIENQFFVNKIPQLNSVELSSKKAELAAASKVVNGGRFLTNSNKVFLLSAVGQDDKGKLALTLVKKYGFKTSLIQTIKKDVTGEVIVLTEKKGQSAITVYLGAGNYIKPEQKLNQYDGFYFDTSIPLSSLYHMLKNKPHDKPCLLDMPNKHKEFDKKMLQYVTFFMPNRFETEILIKSKITRIEHAFSAAKYLRQFCPHNIIITLDKDGFIVVNQYMQQHVSAKKISITDATGAGDIFRGIFFNQYLKNQNILENLNFANQAAAYSVSTEGLDNSIKATQQKFKNQLM